MKKISIEVDEETHLQLLKIQLDQTIKAGSKVTLAKAVSDYLRENLVKTEKPAK